MKTFRLSLLALAAAGVLSACGDNVDDRTAGERVDDTVARAKGASPGVAAPAQSTPALPAPSAANPAANAPDTSVMGAAPAAADRAPDAQITARVSQAIASEKDLRGLRVDVDTREGVVTVSGAVPSAAAKARITEVAKSVKDVRSVNDQLTLAAG
jgi:hypothetical protein